MTRHPLLLALLAASAPAFAQSSVNINGVVDAFAGSRELAGGVRTTRVDSGGLTTSQLNFSGSRDLGNDVKGEFLLGMFLRTNNGASGRFDGDTFFGRSAYVGLSGRMGAVRLGRQTTGNFLNFIRTNTFGDSAVFGPAMVHTWISAIAQGPQFVTAGAPPSSRSLTGPLGTTDTAWNNTVSYISPSLAGITVNAQWAPSNTAGVGQRAGLSAFYANGPLNVGVAMEHFGRNAVPASGPAAAVYDGMSHWSLNGAYTFSFARVSAGYMTTKRDFTSIADDRVRTAYVGATIPTGFGSFLWQTAQTRQTPDGAAARTRTSTSIAWQYPLWKDTDVYAVAMNDRFTGLAAGNSAGIGLRYRF